MSSQPEKKPSLLKDQINIAIKVPEYTPEQLEAAVLRARQRRAEEIGLCRWDCPLCEGGGYLSNNGVFEYCPNVDLWKSQSASSYFGIDRHEAEHLMWDSIMPGLERGIDAIQRVLERKRGWVFIHGDYGVGKTLLLKTAIAETLRNHWDAAYVRMAEIMDDLRAGFDEETRESDTARLRRWMGMKVLAIDELDRMRNTEYATERRFLLLDERYENATRHESESVTIMASNAPHTEYPPYLSDRITDGRFEIVRITGKSRRPIMVNTSGWE